MNLLANLFKRNIQAEPIVQKTAKEKQLIFIKESLKPLLKAEGYSTAGNKWWKVNGQFFNFFELQNFSWNSSNSVYFCFNFTTGFTSEMSSAGKPKIHNGITYVRENYFSVTEIEYWSKANGYHIDANTDLNRFTTRVLDDFKLLILPKLNLLTNRDAILKFYSDEFWAPRVEQSLQLGYKNVQVNP